MKRFILLIVIILLFTTKVNALDISAPTAPEAAQELMPAQQGSFGGDLWYIIKNAVAELSPGIRSTAEICLSIIAVMLIVVMVKDLSGLSARTVELAGVVSVGTLLMSSSNSLIRLSATTVESISQYGKLLLPVMTSALAAQGGGTTSVALYTGTVIFDTILTQIIANLIIPVLYAYLAISLVLPSVGTSMLKNFKNLSKWLMTWTLKLSIYIFTGYLGITKVISGTTDAAALRAAKLTLSGAVPVVGGIISDTSEAILVSAGIVKNAAGIYGILAIISICAVPFLTIGIQYLLLKLTAGICGLFSRGKTIDIIQDYSFAMGILLAATGTICIMLLISTVCFMKGVS